MPPVEAQARLWCLEVGDIVAGVAVVPELLLLVREVAQPIPLGAPLRVEGDLMGRSEAEPGPGIWTWIYSYHVIQNGFSHGFEGMMKGILVPRK